MFPAVNTLSVISLQNNIQLVSYIRVTYDNVRSCRYGRIVLLMLLHPGCSDIYDIPSSRLLHFYNFEIIFLLPRCLPTCFFRPYFDVSHFLLQNTKSIYLWLGNWLPWSEFIISGFPFRFRNAFFNALITIRVSRVSSTSHPTIYRLFQSIMAVRNTCPCSIAIYVMSIDHA